MLLLVIKDMHLLLENSTLFFKTFQMVNEFELNMLDKNNVRVISLFD